MKPLNSIIVAQSPVTVLFTTIGAGPYALPED